jgi:hypothetical protein
MEAVPSELKVQIYLRLKGLQDKFGVEAGAIQILDFMLQKTCKVEHRRQLVEILNKEELIRDAITRLSENPTRPPIKIPNNFTQAVQRAALSYLKRDHKVVGLMKLAEEVLSLEP